MCHKQIDFTIAFTVLVLLPRLFKGYTKVQAFQERANFEHSIHDEPLFYINFDRVHQLT